MADLNAALYFVTRGKLKYLTFHFLEWRSNPQPVAFTVTVRTLVPLRHNGPYVVSSITHEEKNILYKFIYRGVRYDLNLNRLKLNLNFANKLWKHIFSFRILGIVKKLVHM